MSIQMNLKEGIKTSEFWLTIVVAGTLIANEVLNWGLEIVTIIGLFTVASTYVYGRSKVKSNDL